MGDEVGDKSIAPRRDSALTLAFLSKDGNSLLFLVVDVVVVVGVAVVIGFSVSVKCDATTTTTTK